MGVTNTNSYDGPFYPNGVTTSFPFTFKALNASEVMLLDGDGQPISGFNVTVTPSTVTDGGTALFELAPTAEQLPVLYIVSNVAFGVGVNLGSVTAFNPRSLNPSFERLSAQTILLKENQARTPVLPVTGGREGDVPAVAAGGGGFEMISGAAPASRYASWIWSDDTTPVAEGQTEFGVPGVADARVRVLRNTVVLPETSYVLDPITEQLTLLSPAHDGDILFVETVGNGSTLMRALAQHVRALAIDGLASDVQTELSRRAASNFANVPGFEEVDPDFEASDRAAIIHYPGLIFINPEAGPEDARSIFFIRRADYAGGNGGSAEHGGAGWVNANLHIITDAGESARANEWATLSVLRNKAPGTGVPLPQNAALYALGQKLVRDDGLPTSPTIAGVVELEDFTINPTTSSVTLELDSSVEGPNNTDDNNARVMLHMAPRTRSGTDGGNEISHGLFFTPTDGIHVKTMFKALLAGGTIGTYFDLPNFVLTSSGDLAAHQLRAARSSADAPINARLAVAIDGVEYLKAWVDNGGNAMFGASETVAVRVNPLANAVQPLSDNEMRLGGGANRFAEAYIGNATINTSDQALKTGLQGYSDAELDAIGDVAIGAYQWLDAVAEKGEAAARLHSGAIAQQVEAAFAARGLSARRYAFWCADPVMETVIEERTVSEPATITVETTKIEHRFDGDRAERVMVPVKETRLAPPEMVPEYDDEGRPVMIAGSPARYERRLRQGAKPFSHDPADYEEIIVREALPERQATVPRTRMVDVTRQVAVERQAIDPVSGEPLLRLGLRYSEMLVMMQAWSRRELARLAQRVEALEAAA